MTNTDHTGETKVADDLVQLAIWLEGQAVFHETSIARRDPFVIDHIKWLRASSAAVTSLRAQLAAATKALEEIAKQGWFDVTPGVLRDLASEALRSLKPDGGGK